MAKLGYVDLYWYDLDTFDPEKAKGNICEVDTGFQEPNLAGDVPIIENGDLSACVEVVAYSHFQEYDGWEDSWPVCFAIYDMDNGKCDYLGIFRVEMEFEPTFEAECIKEK